MQNYPGLCLCGEHSPLACNFCVCVHPQSKAPKLGKIHYAWTMNFYKSETLPWHLDCAYSAFAKRTSGTCRNPWNSSILPTYITEAHKSLPVSKITEYIQKTLKKGNVLPHFLFLGWIIDCISITAWFRTLTVPMFMCYGELLLIYKAFCFRTFSSNLWRAINKDKGDSPDEKCALLSLTWFFLPMSNMNTQIRLHRPAPGPELLSEHRY